MTDVPAIEFVPTVAKFFPAARRAASAPVFTSHRGARFAEIFTRLHENLRRLSGGRYRAVVAAGSGTWANELAAWNFAEAENPPLVLVNGEFGERLFAQVARASGGRALRADFGWGETISEEKLRERLRATPRVSRIFCVACETSWGGVTNLAALDRAAREHGAEIVLDAMSAVGFSPEIFAFPSVRAISASSGKGLAGVPGLALLFVRGNAVPATRGKRMPVSLDLAAHEAATAAGEPLNTIGSNPVAILNASVEEILTLGQERYRERLAALKSRIVGIFARRGFEAFPGSDSPMITAFRRSRDAHADEALAASLARAGIEIYERPKYLRKRGLFEVATMGDFSSADIDALEAALR
ncbi:MAG: aminotransferase class V-fold PLP-dependent enzyme [Candidatus Spyradosoma sp.]